MIRSPQQVKVLASASRTTSQLANYFKNPEGARQLMVTVNVTIAGTGSITPTVGFITASGVKVPLLVGAAQTTNGAINLQVGMDLTAAANLIAKNSVPASLYVDVVANNANPVTYTVDAEFLP